MGESATSAYRAAYGAGQKAAEANGTRLMRDDSVRARIDRVRAEYREHVEEQERLEQKRRFLSLDRKRELLCEQAEGRLPTKIVQTKDGPVKHYEPLRAIEVDAKLTGELGKGAGVRVNVAVGINVLTEERRAVLMAKKQAAIERRLALKAKG